MVTIAPPLKSFTSKDLDRILEHTKERLPRYLFRGFHGSSGGHADLNTLDAITPLAFSSHAQQSVPEDISELDPNNVLEYSCKHLLSDHGFDTYVSSWSQSIFTAIAMGGTQFLAIVDTARLPDHNKILFMQIRTSRSSIQ